MHAATDGGSEVGTGSRETPSRLPRAGLRHGRDDVRLVRQALNSDAVSLSRSPLCELPGVVALARHQQSAADIIAQLTTQIETQRICAANHTWRS